MSYLWGTYLGVRLLEESLHCAHHKIWGHITCTTSNIIYLISCRICGIQYIGETKNSLKKRFYGHRSTVKTQKLDTPVGQHFNLPTPFLTWSCKALRCLLTTGNRSVSAEKRCGSGVSTPFTPMVSTYRKGMTNFPLFLSFFLVLFFLHKHFYIFIFIYLFIIIFIFNLYLF